MGPWAYQAPEMHDAEWSPVPWATSSPVLWHNHMLDPWPGSLGEQVLSETQKL